MEELMIAIKNINKSYKDNILYKNFNISFAKNKVNCILGKSGCGKSTLLNIISGLVKNDTNSLKTIEQREISYIFQEDRLIEWLNVEENIKIVGKKFYDKEELEDICNYYLDMVGIKKFKTYYPQKLSGGIRQRINIIRAFIYPSKIVIMDEPFKSIDVKNKKIIMENLKNILIKDKRTVLFVTHDIEEALFLADKIFILGDSPVKIKETIENNINLSKEEIYKMI
ncbi:ABC transporter ATP-binding protein [Romboutsia maritimum]|uniref:ABC transporter ATP-binding protein n=1 Tax=Romboutsia maritimum TaxID=2020948 RepID=A0A371IT27_9FIRM|nr:ABC transporter ATP-binding protein [Romboutsia maritimum]RDY23648.1 ABC transporter ATP-binding protein [Romboutsia maritimum]